MYHRSCANLEAETHALSALNVIAHALGLVETTPVSLLVPCSSTVLSFNIAILQGLDPAAPPTPVAIPRLELGEYTPRILHIHLTLVFQQLAPPLAPTGSFLETKLSKPDSD